MIHAHRAERVNGYLVGLSLPTFWRVWCDVCGATPREAFVDWHGRRYFERTHECADAAVRLPNNKEQ